METKLGKIRKARFGFGGYQEVMFGISFDFDLNGSGVGDFWGDWGPDIDVTPNTKWTEAERINRLGSTSMRIAKLMKQAKVEDVKDLVGIPVEVKFDGNVLHSWRVLSEVL
jgi:hypothetical protein